MESSVATQIDLAHPQAEDNIVRPVGGVSSAPRLTVLKIAFGVFLGNLAFGLVAVVIYGIETGAIAHW